MDLSNLLLVSHHPPDRSVSPCTSMYNVFIGPERCYDALAQIYTRDSFDKIQQTVRSTIGHASGVLFNSLGSLLSANSIYLLKECIRHSLPVYVYWHETAWNQRWFQQRHTSDFGEAHALLTAAKTIHWVPSVQNQQLICHIFDVTEDKTRIVYEVVDLKNFYPRPRSTTSSRTKFVVGGAGVPTARKGTDLFVHLANTIPTIDGLDAIFQWYWSDAVSATFLNQVRTPRMKWMGYEQRFSDALRNLDAFCLTSRDDPSPLVAFEALACNVPVFCLESTGIAEIVPEFFSCSSIREMAFKLENFGLEKGKWTGDEFSSIAQHFGVAQFRERAARSSFRSPNSPRSTREVLQDSARQRLTAGPWKEDIHYQNTMMTAELKGLAKAALSNATRRANGRTTSLRKRLLAGSEGAVSKNKRTLQKKVIIVGNSPKVLERELGQEIDQYEEVIRINNFQLQDYESHVGSKTTRAFVSPACGTNPVITALPASEVYLYRAHQFSAADDDVVRARMLRPDGLGLEATELAKLAPYLYFHRLRAALGLKGKQWPSTGLVAIAWALDEFSATHTIDLHGFSFYQESGSELQHYFNHVTARDSHHDFRKEQAFVERAIDMGRIGVLHGRE